MIRGRSPHSSLDDVSASRLYAISHAPLSHAHEDRSQANTRDSARNSSLEERARAATSRCASMRIPGPITDLYVRPPLLCACSTLHSLTESASLLRVPPGSPHLRDPAHQRISSSFPPSSKATHPPTFRCFSPNVTDNSGIPTYWSSYPSPLLTRLHRCTFDITRTKLRNEMEKADGARPHTAPPARRANQTTQR